MLGKKLNIAYEVTYNDSYTYFVADFDNFDNISIWISIHIMHLIYICISKYLEGFSSM